MVTHPARNKGAASLRILVAGTQLSPHSGTSKVAVELVRELRRMGCLVETHFLTQSPDLSLLGDTGVSARPTTWRTRFTGVLSTAAQLPLLRTVWNLGFTPQDSVDLIGAVTERDFFVKARRADLIVFMNFWAAIPIFRIDPRHRPPTVVYFHELPQFTEVPPPLGFAMRGIVRWVAHSCSTVVSVSAQIRQAVQAQLERDSLVLYHAVRPLAAQRTKAEYILLDTRWTDARRPEFVATLAQLLPEYKIRMAGYFPSDEIRRRLEADIRRLGLDERIELLERLPEGRLNSLFASARFYIRWSADGGEAGPSVGVFQAIGNLCPPIVDDQLGAADFLKMAGLDRLVVTRDAAAFAQRVRELAKDPAIYASTLDTLEQVGLKFGWDAYCRRLLDAAIPRSPA